MIIFTKGNVMKSAAEIKNELNNYDIKNIRAFINEYSNDARAGVRKLVAAANKKYEAYAAELERTRHISEYENKLKTKGFKYICGIDEVGRGPLAGPVAAACVILPDSCDILGINDSKKLSAKKREALFDIINKKALSVGIGIISNDVIDDVNILQATFMAMREAIKNSPITPDYILVDGNFTIPKTDIPQKAVIKGDAKSISIGAASIIAKVTRDRLMMEYSKKYPYYGFETNVGYGSAKHIEAIKKYGLCPIHRKSFTGNFV